MDLDAYRRFVEITDGSKNDVSQNLPVRPVNGNTQGRETMVQLNFFNVQQFPMKKVYQYDVTMIRAQGQVDEKQRNFMRKAWASKAVQNKIGKGWLYDNNKLAW
jgi:eukaryotic translation initiation factor 2C